MDIVGDRNLAYLIDQRIRRGGPFVDLEDGSSVDWPLMGELISRRQAWLAAQGIGSGSKVILFQRTGVSLLASMFALYRLGAIAVMPSSESTSRELAFILGDSRSDLLLVEDEGSLIEVVTLLPKTARTVPVSVVAVDPVSNPDACDQRPYSSEFSGSPTTPATLLYTSGSTSQPKGVLYSHGNHVFAAETMARIFGILPGYKILHHFPLNHTNGIAQMFSAVVCGTRLYLRQRFRSGDFQEILERWQPDFTFLNSTQIKMVLQVVETRQLRPWSTSTLRTIGSGGEISSELRLQLESHYGGRLIECYGSTESIAVCCANPLSMPVPGSCGLPAMGYILTIPESDASGLGEIYVKSFSPYGMFRGYWRRPKASRAVLRRNVYKTGDLGRFNSEGYLYFEGRINEIIKRGGENISPRELEAVIAAHPAVREVAVIGVTDDLRDEVPVAFVATHGGLADVGDLDSFCRERLAKFKVPSRFLLLDDLPHTGTGKIDKAQLRELARQ